MVFVSICIFVNSLSMHVQLSCGPRVIDFISLSFVFAWSTLAGLEEC